MGELIPEERARPNRPGQPDFYISGPYTKGDPVMNTRDVILAAEKVLATGHVPIIPHLAMFWHFMSPKPWEEWIKYDMGLLSACSIIWRLPGESKGADMEVAQAKEWGLCFADSFTEVECLISVLYCRGGY